MRKRQLPSLLLSYGSLDIIHTQINVASFFERNRISHYCYCYIVNPF